MKILFLCNKSPWPPREGGPMAMNMLAEGMARAGHSVKILAVDSFKYHISQQDIPSSYAAMTGIELIPVDLRVKLFPALYNLLIHRSYHVQRFISHAFAKRVRELLESVDFDVVQMETLYMSPYLKTVRSCSKARIFLRAHNIEHRIWKRVAEETRNPLKKLYINQLAKALKKYEEQVVRQYDGVVAITSTDASYFNQLARKVAAIPFGIDPSKYPVEHGDNDLPSLFTLGSMNWIPNQEGIRWFLTQVWPDVHRQFPELKYYLAGREMPGWMQSLEIGNVVVLGEVEDARRFIASKTIMIVPLFSGSGIRIKIIEGLAMGKTIISTTLGAEGIDCKQGQDILLADLPCDFFEMISVAVSDADLRRKLGSNARKLVETSYNEAVLIENLTGFYKEICL